jgi:hypothetical protein
LVRILNGQPIAAAVRSERPDGPEWLFFLLFLHFGFPLIFCIRLEEC